LDGYEKLVEKNLIANRSEGLRQAAINYLLEMNKLFDITEVEMEEFEKQLLL